MVHSFLICRFLSRRWSDFFKPKSLPEKPKPCGEKNLSLFVFENKAFYRNQPRPRSIGLKGKLGADVNNILQNSQSVVCVCPSVSVNIGAFNGNAFISLNVPFVRLLFLSLKNPTPVFAFYCVFALKSAKLRGMGVF